MEVTKLRLNNGMILTVTIEKEDTTSIEGKDKNGYGVKILKEEIKSRTPCTY
jgi:hypothetical protein